MSDVNQKSFAYQEAIKCIGVGKKGSRDMPSGLVGALLEEKRAGQVPDEAWGALLGALSVKGPSEEEKAFNNALPAGGFSQPESLIDHLEPGLSRELNKIFKKLIAQQTLEEQEAVSLASYLFAPTSNATLKGMAASIMRMRYETSDEYKGILSFLKTTFADGFLTPPPKGAPIVQFAEPFDGLVHSHIITPAVIARLGADIKMRPVSLCGRNSGPKLCVNLYDIAKEMDGTFLRSSNELTDGAPSDGYYLDQARLSPQMDPWVDIRRTIIKRPFLSTLERFVNPFDADILIASAFHPPYGEKMLKICEDQGAKAAIIVRNGIEGTIAFPLLRSAKVLATKRKTSGDYQRREFNFDSQRELGHTIRIEERIETPNAHDNARLIKSHLERKNSGHEAFDTRVEATCRGLGQAIAWLVNE